MASTCISCPPSTGAGERSPIATERYGAASSSREDGFRFIYTGDTGYSRDFADIRARFDAFDLAAIPIGAYAPRWFMSTQHVDPAEAVQIHRDLNARRSLAVHWGTFVLTDEPLDEPPRKLAEALDAAGVARNDFWVFRHGEMRVLASRDEQSQTPSPQQRQRDRAQTPP